MIDESAQTQGTFPKGGSASKGLQAVHKQWALWTIRRFRFIHPELTMFQRAVSNSRRGRFPVSPLRNQTHYISVARQLRHVHGAKPSLLGCFRGPPRLTQRRAASFAMCRIAAFDAATNLAALPCR